MSGSTENIDTLKQNMRREAIGRRKEVGEDERAEAGVRLGELAAQLLNGLLNGQEGEDFRADIGPTTNEVNDVDHSVTIDTNDSNDIGINLSVPINTNWLTTALKPGDMVAAYVSMGTEVSTFGLLDELDECELRVLVPQLGSGRDIGWSKYGGKSGLHKMPHTATGGLRPAEPDGKTLEPEAIADAKIVFIPAFAIDLDGTRLGRGGGWYDQVLGLCRADAIKIGVCWDWEFINRHGAVPREVHDIPVNTVITNKRIIILQ
ncbi:hypothetical protein OZX62_02265 [Bifidobacterium sp. ESL0690]|uniref:5-formyltetrahydrofolate cyclo-ligase n=1 Tax=Bifidobacterium sp. ESL0690 TaxID=2983214 RepID=UPI0023F864FF|nr:5-formyltetrahydrofolate cyclo-ligase [Bifidobacterium sp. ESL0690]WEV47140.1 hypothetical protein OZX62_02265 [Bifidobacterium sp. ESL0690]